VPELVTIDAAHVNDPYLRWVLAETSPDRPPRAGQSPSPFPSEDEGE
jgi:hypothetical protein